MYRKLFIKVIKSRRRAINNLLSNVRLRRPSKMCKPVLQNKLSSGFTRA
uniref:Uncharacterized protein n=1 Tax=Arundo donax TaxID=35708 RepID=A0A0A8ZHJ6_ARUDO